MGKNRKHKGNTLCDNCKVLGINTLQSCSIVNRTSAKNKVCRSSIRKLLSLKIIALKLIVVLLIPDKDMWNKRVVHIEG